MKEYTKRHTGLIDFDLMQSTRIAIIGVGGGSDKSRWLARLGLGHVTCIDHDIVAATNIGTQNYNADQVGKYKVEALAQDIRRDSPHCTVVPCPVKLEELNAEQHQSLLKADLILAMADNFQVQAKLNRFACQQRKDTLFAAAYANSDGIEMTGTFPENLDNGTGCHRCHLFPRYHEYAHGFEPPETINSHIVQAELLNAMQSYLIVSLLHLRGGSKLGHPEIARQFIERPLLMTRVNPLYAMGAYEDTPETHQLFLTRYWPPELPDGYVCPDCGAKAKCAA